MFFFSYGTLMRGDCRHHLLAKSRFIGVAKTSIDYTLYSCGSFPAMVPSNNHKTGVTGELYEIDESLLDDCLDQVEATPWLYDRAIIPIIKIEPANSSITEATTYIYQRPVDSLIHLGETWNVRKSVY